MKRKTSSEIAGKVMNQYSSQIGRGVIIIINVLCWCYSVTASTISQIKKDSFDIHVDSAFLLNEKGRESYRLGEYEMAESCYLNSLELKINNLPVNDLRIGNSYLNLAILYRSSYRYNKAIEYIDKAEKIYSWYPDSTKHMGTLYLMKALIYFDIFDFDASLLLYRKVIDMLPANDPNLISVYFNLGELYFAQSNYSVALTNFLKAASLSKDKFPAFHAKSQRMIAKTYSAMNDPENAGFYYRRSIAELKRIYGDQHFEIARTYITYSEYFYENSEKDSCLFYSKKAVEMLVQRFGEYNKSVATAYIALGKAYLYQNMYLMALVNFQDALIAVSNNFHSIDWHSNPLPNDSYLLTELLEVLKLKANTLRLFYLQTKNLELLNSCVETYQLTVEVIDNLRDQYLSELSKIKMNEFESDIYALAADAAYSNYVANNSNIYESAETAFFFSEKNKASVLLSSIRNLSALKTTNIPTELNSEEEALRKEIALLHELIYEEQKEINPDDTLINRWENRLIESNNNYKKLIKILDENYPNYYNLKYNHNTLGLHELQAGLKPGEMIVEYLTNDTILFIYTISNNSFHINRCRIDQGFYNSFDQLMNEVRTGGVDSQWDSSYNRFVKASNTIYQTIISPIENEIVDINHLIIIPSGILSYLPFEVLIKEVPESPKPNYKELSYLINNYSISYAYSATTLFEKGERSLNAQKKLLAVAPIYFTQAEPMNNPLKNTRQQYRQNLAPLRGIKEEVEIILSLIDGEALMDSNALESLFKKRAPDFDILHMAMHSYIDDDNPLYSKLIFSNGSDTENDGFLNTYEIYNMTLNARMTVLSSCNTGVGKLGRGEGIISLARGFQYAGCPNVVMTLWEVEDKSGVNLMAAYYKNLRAGYTKDKALRLAKLKFLTEADQLKSHPYFWANYITIGETAALYTIYQQLWFIIMVSSILCILLTGLIWQIFHKKHVD